MVEKTRRSQYEALSAAYDRFCEELANCPDPIAEALAQSWQQTKAQHNEWLDKPGSKITPSRLASGMKQGLRDMQTMLRLCPEEIRKPLLSRFHRIIDEEVPEFFSSERQKLAQILERGFLQNENEWNLVRHRVDDLEADTTHGSELTDLYELLDRYETQ